MERDVERDVEIQSPEDTDARKGERGNPEDSSLPPLDQGEGEDEGEGP